MITENAIIKRDHSRDHALLFCVITCDQHRKTTTNNCCKNSASMSADLIGWKGYFIVELCEYNNLLKFPYLITSNVFDGQNCRCLKCYPSCDNALLVRVTPAITLCNDIFKSFEDAMKCCNLLAQQQNLPRLHEGNKQHNAKRVKCSGCKKQFMTFKNEPVRLLNHNSLVAYLEHSCIPQSLSDDKGISSCILSNSY